MTLRLSSGIIAKKVANALVTIAVGLLANGTAVAVSDVSSNRLELGASPSLGMEEVLAATAPGTNIFWFPVGERLSYRLYWGIISVGSSEMSSEWVEENGRKYLMLRAVARTGPILSKIYAVDDRIETLVEPDTFLPVRYVQRLKEGRHRRYDVIEFDHKSGVAYWTSGLTNATKQLKIEADTRDVLSLAYYMRSKQAAVGDKHSFKVIVDNKLYDLELTALAGEEMPILGGKAKCLRIEPKAKFGAIFVRKGKVLMWFSDDERRICAKMVGKVPVANVKAVLSGVDGWGNSVWPRRDVKL